MHSSLDICHFACILYIIKRKVVNAVPDCTEVSIYEKINKLAFMRRVVSVCCVE